jgi:Tfp pilus assembly protein PilN
MANVNLISARRAERVRLAKIARAVAGAVVVTGIIGFGTVAFAAGQFLVARSRIASAEAELVRLKPVLAGIEAAEAEREVLRPKLVTLTDAQKSTNRWFGIMDGLKRAVPDQTWLTNISVEAGAEGPGLLRINGMTTSQSRVGETMFRLNQQTDFYSGIDLRYTQVSKFDTVDAVEFELAAQLSQPEAEAKEGASNATQSN